MKKAKGVQSRRLALETLVQIDKYGFFFGAALAKSFARKQLSSRDRAFVTALVMGVIRHRNKLDAVIKQYSSQKIEKLPVMLLNNLRLGIFQLEEMPDLPPSAVLNTATELAKALGHVGQARFVNGLLRNYLSTKNKAEEKDIRIEQESSGQNASGQPSNNLSLAKSDDLAFLSQTYSMPYWIVERWHNNFGYEEALLLLKAAQIPGKLILRTCTSAITIEGLMAFLTAKGFTLRRGFLVPTCLIVESSAKDKSLARSPQMIPGYVEGLFSIQDEASAFVSIVVDPKPGQLVVDLCAAPGGKTTHLSELMGGAGQVIAIDKSTKRLDVIRENRARLNLTNIQIDEGDCRTITLDKLADRVLLDAPCTGTGVISRRPDIRYHRQESDLAKLVKQQRELLDHAATLVKPGGTLTYSTCSLEPEENIENIHWFLENHKEFKPISLLPYVPAKTLAEWADAERVKGLKRTSADHLSHGFIQLLPSRHGVTGFFVCSMMKN